jgi:hypothetical protein
VDWGEEVCVKGAFVSPWTRVPFAYALVEVVLWSLLEGPVGGGCGWVWVWTGPGVYKEQEVVAWDAFRYMLQNAEDLLCPEKARFHKVGLISVHFVWRLLAAFFLNATSYCCHALPCSVSTMMRIYSKINDVHFIVYCYFRIHALTKKIVRLLNSQLPQQVCQS